MDHNNFAFIVDLIIPIYDFMQKHDIVTRD